MTVIIKFLSGAVIYCCAVFVAKGQPRAPLPFGPVPDKNQVRWQQMEYYAFVHFSLNTYTDQSWGFGNEDIRLFNPAKLDCRQWARVCKQAGMKGIIITAKHHCGFCLWPSRFTEYSVKNAPWKNGKGDIMREMAAACSEYGLQLGIYLSPWDRNNADYGKPGYITYFRNQLTELLTNYGPIFEVWFDGANGGSGYYGGANETRTIDPTTYYEWENTYKLIRKLQPNCVIWNDGGNRGDLRWVGTEAGEVGETNWSLLDSIGVVTWNMLHNGLENGNAWVPGEVNTSIRPEWFYHPGENDRVKTVPELMEIYYHSIGRNASLLLNFPIDTRGLIPENDEKAALAFDAAVKQAFALNLALKKPATATNVRGNLSQFAAAMVTDGNPATFWATNDNIKTASLIIDFGKPTIFNRVLVQEYIPLGQRVKAFAVEALLDKTWTELATGTTIGYKRIVSFKSVTGTKLRLTVTDAKSCPVISNIGVYNAPQILTAPVIIRKQTGEVNIIPVDSESEVYYTLDGTVPDKKSTRYMGPFITTGKLQVTAIALERVSGKSSPPASEKFDIERKNWKLVNIKDEKAAALLDGDPNTAWHQPGDKTMPIDLVIDLGEAQNLTGFRYLPDHNIWNRGIISQYGFYVSENNVDWQLKDAGEFSNIKNNPLWQVKTFAPVTARFIKLRALRNTDNNNNTGYAELDVITR